MKQSRFTEEQIIAVLREQEAGSKTGDVCRKHGISSATFWKAKYGGLEVSEARRLAVQRATENAAARLCESLQSPDARKLLKVTLLFGLDHAQCEDCALGHGYNRQRACSPAPFFLPPLPQLQRDVQPAAPPTLIEHCPPEPNKHPPDSNCNWMTL